MNAESLILTIQQMTPDERRRFGVALAECGVSVVLSKPYNPSGDVGEYPLRGYNRPKLGSAKQETPINE